MWIKIWNIIKNLPALIDAIDDIVTNYKSDAKKK